jgi:hypothetical protein
MVDGLPIILTFDVVARVFEESDVQFHMREPSQLKSMLRTFHPICRLIILSNADDCATQSRVMHGRVRRSRGNND